ncbi:HAD-IIIA family hydrolase [Candidatus Woesearchaeota archaeon]|nr:HAD-IIIA family hydrolase [Candidatus Woesearchaeota archaeon]
MKELLVCLDRDGTLIEKVDFLGKNNNWKEEIKLNKSVVDFLKYIQSNYKCIFIVISNQGGVVRGYFDCNRVKEINGFIDSLLKKQSIFMENWQYCPDADLEFYEKNKDKIDFNLKYVKQKTKRKPNPEMFYDSLKNLNKKIQDFDQILVLGDSEDDKLFAKNINAFFIDVNNKEYDELLTEIENI